MAKPDDDDDVIYKITTSERTDDDHKEEENLLKEENTNVADNDDPIFPGVEHNGHGTIVSKDIPIQMQYADDKSGETRGWTWVLILASITCCLGSAVPAGFNIGVMNNAAQIMKDFCNNSVHQRYNIELTKDGLDFLWSSIVSIFLIGGVTGSLTSSILANKLGRRGALSIGNITGILGAISFFLTPTLNSVELFLIGRLMVGLSGGLATSLIPTYMTEVAPISLRGSVGVLCQLGITCGVLFGQIAGLDNVLGTTESWHIMLSVFAPLCIFALIFTLLLPESPKYLFVVREQREEALIALAHFRNMDIMLLQREITDLESELKIKATSTAWSIYKVLRDSSLRLPLFLVCILQLGQQLSGINAVFYYSNTIFKNAALNPRESQFVTIGTGLANIGMAIVSVILMSKFGRRTLLLTSAYTTIICLVILCFSIVYIDLSPIMPWLCIFAVLSFVTTYGIGLGPIPYFIGSELFDVGPRSAAMSIGSVCNWGGNFIVGMFFTLLQSFIGPYSFLTFVACVLFLALFSKRYLPETRGRTTTEIAASITDGLRSQPLNY